jgi:hypothetical protein
MVPLLPTSAVTAGTFPEGMVHPSSTTIPWSKSPMYNNIDKQKNSESNLEMLRDFRLEQCEDKGKNWEQCFFFGTGTISVTKKSGNYIMKPRKQFQPGAPTW